MLFAILKKVLIIFTTSIENVNSVMFNGELNVTVRRKINYQIKENYIMKKNVLLAKSKINQQKRNYERKIFKQQVEELNKKLNI